MASQTLYVVLTVVASIAGAATGSGNSILHYSILEEVGPGSTFVGNLMTDYLELLRAEATGRNAQHQPEQLALLPGRHQNLFTIDSKSGVLRTRGPIDRDAICTAELLTDGDADDGSCVLTLEVAVIRPVESFRAFNIDVTVEDVNDNVPKFDHERYTIFVSENAVPEVGTYPLPVARDADFGILSVQSYALRLLSGPNDTFSLRMSPTSGGSSDGNGDDAVPNLVLNRPVDRETTARYELELVAYDGGRPQLSGTLPISVVVVDVNDNSPQFVRSSYNATVLETAEPSITIVRIQATDRDDGPNGEVSYMLTDSSRELYGQQFRLNNSTGELTLAKRFEADYRDVYVLTVAAVDRGSEPRTSTVKVTVNVDDVNQHPPSISIDALTPSGRAEVVENQPAGKFVAYVSVNDADRGVNGEVHCTVASSNFSMQLVHRNLYKLTTSIAFDRETVDRYIAVIRCSDLGIPALASTGWTEVQILDDNDNSPQFVRRVFEASIVENSPPGRSVLTVTASDADLGLNAQLQYNLLRSSSDTAASSAKSKKGIMTIDPQSGVLSISSDTDLVLDHESKPEMEFVVVATDRGNPPRSSSATIRVTVLNENDCRPTFTQPAFSFGVFENLPPETEVGTVSALDLDMPPYNDFYYMLQSSATTSAGSPGFVIDAMTGKITTTSRLDREAKAVYYLTAMAIDSHNTSLTSTADITVYVADKNDNKPVFVFPTASNYTMQVSTYSPIGYTIARIQATDADVGINAMIVYGLQTSSMTSSMASSAPSTSDQDIQLQQQQLPFDVDTNNGAIYLTRSLRLSAPRDFVVTVTASDRGNPPMSASATVVIRVNDSLSYAAAQSLLSTTGGGYKPGDNRGLSGGSGNDQVTASSFHFAFNQQVLVVMAAVTAIVVMLLVAAIVFVRRRQLQRLQLNERCCHGNELNKDLSNDQQVPLPTVSNDVTDSYSGLHTTGLHVVEYDDFLNCSSLEAHMEPEVGGGSNAQPFPVHYPTMNAPCSMQGHALYDNLRGARTISRDFRCSMTTDTSDSGRGLSAESDCDFPPATPNYNNLQMITFLPRGSQTGSGNAIPCVPSEHLSPNTSFSLPTRRLRDELVQPRRSSRCKRCDKNSAGVSRLNGCSEGEHDETLPLRAAAADSDRQNGGTFSTAVDVACHDHQAALLYGHNWSPIDDREPEANGNVKSACVKSYPRRQSATDDVTIASTHQRTPSVKRGNLSRFHSADSPSTTLPNPGVEKRTNVDPCFRQVTLPPRASTPSRQLTVRVAPINVRESAPPPPPPLPTSSSLLTGSFRSAGTKFDTQNGHSRRRLPPLPPVSSVSVPAAATVGISKPIPAVTSSSQIRDPAVPLTTDIDCSADSADAIEPRDAPFLSSDGFVGHMHPPHQHHQQQQYRQHFLKDQSQSTVDRRLCTSDL